MHPIWKLSNVSKTMLRLHIFFFLFYRLDDKNMKIGKNLKNRTNVDVGKYSLLVVLVGTFKLDTLVNLTF